MPTFVPKDQNMEPKATETYPHVKSHRLTKQERKESGIYLLHHNRRRSFIGHVSSEMGEEQIKEYIEVQERLAPDDRKKGKKNPGDGNVAESSEPKKSTRRRPKKHKRQAGKEEEGKGEEELKAEIPDSEEEREG